MKPSSITSLFITLGFVCVLFINAHGQSFPEVIYTSPRVESKYNAPNSQILIRFNKPVVADIYQLFNLRVTNSSNDLILGEQKFIDGGQGILFKPFTNLELSHEYQVFLYYQSSANDNVCLIEYRFRITDGLGYSSDTKNNMGSINGGNFADPVKADLYRKENNLPDNFPAIVVSYKDNPLPGHYFVSARQGGNTYPGHNFMICFDTCGTPVYYKMLENRGSDFKVASNGNLAHHHGELGYYVQYDSSYNQIRSHTATPGFTTDMHELIIEDDSSYWVLTKQLHLVDMSAIVPGGNENATVEENLIQHIDKFGNLLWQWNSLDHIPITDCDTRFVDLTAFYIDYIHINALDFDEDGNLLISSRHLNEITKIDETTGDIIWRWGGSSNQFTFIEDPDGFYGQHSIRSQGDDVYTLFDNGNFHDPPRSRGLEYELDQQNLTASFKKEFTTGDAPIYSPFMGHMQKTDNRAVIVGWAANDPGLVLTEFDDVCVKKLEIHNLDTALISYRAYKFPWRTNAFYFLQDTINVYGYASASDTTLTNFNIYNNSDDYLTLAGYHVNLSNIFVVDNFPLVIPPFGTQELTLGLISANAGSYTDALTVYTQIHNDSVRIAAQARVIGDIIVDINQPSTHENHIVINRISNGLIINLKNGQTIDNLNIYDMAGRNIYNINNYDSEVIPIDQLTSLTAPIIISIQSQNRKYVKKYLLSDN